jgi:hypothetical protein
MKLLLLILPIFLYGCGHTPEKEIIVDTVFAPIVCEEFNPIAGIVPLPVKFVEALDMKGNTVLGMTGASYSNLSINSKDTLRYLTEQKAAIKYYEKCIEDHNSKQKEEGQP